MGILAATAGCAATLPPLGQRIRYGRVEAPPRGDPTYRRWLPVPAALELEHDDPADLDLMFSRPNDLGRETFGADFTVGLDMLISRTDYFGIGLREYDWTMTGPRGAVLRGDIPQDHVGSVLTDTIYEAAGEHAGFAVYERTQGEQWVGFSPTTIVTARGEHGRGNLEAIVDAGQGRSDRYHEVDEGIARFTERVGAHPFTWYGTDIDPESFEGDEEGDVADSRLSATTFSFDEDAGYVTYDMLYEPGRLPARQDRRQVLERDNPPLSSASIDIEYDDPFVRVEMRVPAGRLRAQMDEPERSPYVTWLTELDERERVGRFQHLAGEEVDGSLVVRGVRGTEPVFHTSDGRFGPGDHVAVSVASETRSTVRLVWESQDRRASATIESVDVPDRLQEDSTGDGT